MFAVGEFRLNPGDIIEWWSVVEKRVVLDDEIVICSTTKAQMHVGGMCMLISQFGERTVWLNNTGLQHIQTEDMWILMPSWKSSDLVPRKVELET